MERFLLIESPSAPADLADAARDPIENLRRRRGTFGHEVVDWLSKTFSVQDVEYSLGLKRDPTIAPSQTEKSEFRKRDFESERKSSDAASEIQVVGYPAANILLVSGPEALGSVLNYGKRKRGHTVIRLPHRIVSANRSERSPENPQQNDWHLRDPHGVCAPPCRENCGEGTWLGFVDTGIFAQHTEFQGRKIAFARIAEDGLHIETDLPAHDPDGHGTHMAAVAAGNHCGVAPAANLAMAACSLDLNRASAGQVAQQVIAGIEFLLSVRRGGEKDGVGVDVINLSLGIPGYSSVFRPILDTARRSRDVLVIAAVGNRGVDTHDSPADHAGVISVGATDSTGVPWSKSSHAVFGRRRSRTVPHYMAPGVGVWSAYNGGPMEYAPLSGSSIASAVAAGIATASISSNRARSSQFLASSWTFRRRVNWHKEQKFYNILY